MRTSGRTNSTPGWPNLHGAGPGWGWGQYKKRSQSVLPLSLPPIVLFSSCLWVGVPSPLEAGFTYYYLIKIELQHGAATLICLRAITRSVWDLRAITRSVQDPRAVTRRGGFNVRHSKSWLWWTKEFTLAWHSQTRDQIHVSYIGRQILYHWVTREALVRASREHWTSSHMRGSLILIGCGYAILNLSVSACWIL